MTTLRLRYFNQNGIDEFQRCLDEMENQGARISLSALLEDSSYTVPIEQSRSIEVHSFNSRFDCGRYFFKKLETLSDELKLAGIDPVGHRGLWTWLAAAWIEHLLMNSKGMFFVGASERYVLSTQARRDYRHLLYGPWLFYKAAGVENPDLVQIALRDPVTKDSPVFEQLASRREIVSNVAALKLINKCYRDDSTESVYPQAVRSEIPGGLRRFGAVYSQLAVNFDLQNMDEDKIQLLLPVEFKSWLDGIPPTPKTRQIKSRLKKKRAKRKTKHTN